MVTIYTSINRTIDENRMFLFVSGQSTYNVNILIYQSIIVGGQQVLQEKNPWEKFDFNIIDFFKIIMIIIIPC